MSAEDDLKGLAALVNEGRFDEAADLARRAQAAHPGDERIQRARAIVLRRADLPAEAEQHLKAVLAQRPNAAWAHAQIALVYRRRDHARAIDHFRRAHALEPGAHDYRLALVEALARQGDGDLLEEAYQLLRPALHLAQGWAQNDLHIAFDVLSRVCAFDDRDRLGDPMALGRKWAEAGNHTALFMLLGHVGAPEPREALIALHRLAVRRLEAIAAANPIHPPIDDLEDPPGTAP